MCTMCVCMKCVCMKYEVSEFMLPGLISTALLKGGHCVPSPTLKPDSEGPLPVRPDGQTT